MPEYSALSNGGASRPTTDRVETPNDVVEALVISGFLAEGNFLPERYGLTLDDVKAWESAWRYCLDFQRVNHHAPDPSEVEQRYNGFKYTPRANLGYAAMEMQQRSHAERLRKAMAEATEALKTEDPATVQALFERIPRPKYVQRAPLDGFDHANIESELSLYDDRIFVPHQTLGRATGGIARGELWYIAARPSHGKTYTACQYVAKAVQQGKTVRYVSCEMAGHRINTRIARVLAAGKPELLGGLSAAAREDRKYALDTLRDSVSGSWSTVDPSYGRIDNAFVRDQMDEPDLVVIDHVGLMRTNKGHRAIDDWRAMAEISNQIREDNLATSSRVLGLVQISRAGESLSKTPPKGSTLSQSDALLQDCDVLVTMRRASKHVMAYSPEKLRETDGKKWWSLYDPANVDFRELTHDQARDRIALDDEFDED